MCKVVVFSMGLPGAGKSTTLHKLYNLDTFVMVDPDEEKKSLPDYNPKAPWLVHEQSKALADAKESAAIAAEQNLIIDGTGTNTEKMARKMQSLHIIGYTVHLLYVQVKLETAIQRNAQRERTVPQQVIYDKFAEIESAWATLSSLADVAQVYAND